MDRFLLASAAFLVTLAVPAVAVPLDQAGRGKILAAVDAYSGHMNEVAHALWLKPELGYQEFATAALLQDELQKAGFTVEKGVAGMPTAFVAKAGSDDGPVVAILAEMDALPGFSQDAVPVKQAKEGITAGHACGHHLFGAGSVAAAIAVKRWLEESGTKGQIRLYGTPAEEGGSGKAYMTREGVFDDVDIALHWHPGNDNDAGQNGSLANVSGKFRFTGVAAHAAMSPEKGRSALDGVEAMNFMVNAMREHVPSDVRIHYIISNGGQAPNVVPEKAEAYYYVRHPNPAVVAEVMDRVMKAAEGAALGTGTKFEFEQTGGVYSLLPNDALGKLLDKNLRQVGGVIWTPEEIDFAEKLQATFTSKSKPALDSVGQVQPYTSGKPGSASTDVGDVSWVVPTAGISTATFVPGTPFHSWQAVAAGGMSIGAKGTVVAAKTLAATAADLFSDPDLVEAAKSEWKSRRGEGFSYMALVGDRAPPLDYRK